MKKLGIIFLGLLLSACVQTANLSEEDQAIDLSIIEGTGGTAYSVLANAISGAVEMEYQNSITQIILGQPSDNPLRLSEYQADFALTSNINAMYYYNGLYGFEKTENIRFVAGFNSSVIQFALNEELNLTSFEQFAKEAHDLSIRVPEGAAGVLFEALLSVYDLTIEDLLERNIIVHDYDQAIIAELLESDLIDGYFTMSSIPASLVTQTFASADMILVDLEDDRFIEAANKVGFVPYEIEKESYAFLEKNISSFASYTVLLSTDRTNDLLINKLIKALFNRYDYLYDAFPSLSSDVNALLNGQQIPMHPAAVIAYQELGLLK